MKASLFIILMIALYPTNSYSQERKELITEDITAYSRMTSFQINAIKKARGNDANITYKLVKIGDLTTIQEKDEIEFSIPGREKRIKAVANFVQISSPQDYKWYGTVDGGIGSVIILNKDGKITASISLPDQHYEIFSTDTDVELLIVANMEASKHIKVCNLEEGDVSKGNKIKKEVKENNSLFYSARFNEGTDFVNDEANSGFSPYGVNPCNDFVRILVLFTPRAAAAVPDINQTINLCINQFASTVYNSGITSLIVPELAGSQQLSFIEGGNIADDLNSLVNNLGAQQARNNTRADLVVLLTDGSSYGGIAGEAATGDPNNALSYAIVQARSATGDHKIFVHETGHLYGLRHKNDNTTAFPYAHGYTFRKDIFSTQRRTVMVTYAESTSSMVLNFSNPNIYVDGAATGTTTSNNNARRINETYATIRDFRAPPFRPFLATVSGPEYVTANSTYTWEAFTTCGYSPYTYEWRTSSDGVNYSAARGTGVTFIGYLVRQEIIII